MTATEIATQEQAKGSTAVATYDYGEDAGVGFEGSKPSDFKPSFLRILQPNSPQVVDELPGAKMGLWIDSITNEVFKDILFVPAWREHVYVAWKPRNEGGGGGEGFGGVYQLTDKVVVDALAKIENKFERGDDGKIILPRTPDGVYQLIETVYWHGAQILEESQTPIPVTIPMSSTAMPVAGAWYTTLRRQIIPGTPNPYPLFAHVWRLGSLKKERPGQKWWIPTTSWADESATKSRLDPKSAFYQAGRAIAIAFKEGNVKVDYAATRTDEPAGGAGGKGGKGKDSEVPF